MCTIVRTLPPISAVAADPPSNGRPAPFFQLMSMPAFVFFRLPIWTSPSPSDKPPNRYSLFPITSEAWWLPISGREDASCQVCLERSNIIVAPFLLSPLGCCPTTTRYDLLPDLSTPDDTSPAKAQDVAALRAACRLQTTRLWPFHDPDALTECTSVQASSLERCQAQRQCAQCERHAAPIDRGRFLMDFHVFPLLDELDFFFVLFFVDFFLVLFFLVDFFLVDFFFMDFFLVDFFLVDLALPDFFLVLFFFAGAFLVRFFFGAFFLVDLFLLLFFFPTSSWHQLDHDPISPAGVAVV